MSHWTEATRNLVSAAKALGFELRAFTVARPEDFDPAFKALQAWRSQALCSTSNPLTNPGLHRVNDCAKTNRIPTSFDAQALAKAGGLLTNGPAVSELFAQSVGDVDRILRGANPATLPVQMPTRHELFVNRKPATALGIEIPQSLLIRADQVIE